MTGGHKVGCLLIHGFTSSPTEMAGLADFLQAKGYAVKVPRLPGHATIPRDLLGVTHVDWMTTAEEALREIRSFTTSQFVIGLSLGGVLALHLASRFDFDGVVALAPALKLPLWQEVAVRALAPFVEMRKKRSRGPDVRDRYGRSRLDSYREYPLAAARETFRLQRRVRAELANITMPLLVIHSRQDHTVPVSNVEYLTKRVGSRHVETMIVEESYHVLTVDVDRKRIFARIAAFVENVSQRKRTQPAVSEHEPSRD